MDREIHGVAQADDRKAIRARVADEFRIDLVDAALKVLPYLRISSKNFRALGSFDWPSQNIACLRTTGFLLLLAC